MIVNRRTGQWTRVLVNVGGYRRRREESLEGLAQRVAYRCGAEQSPRDVGADAANERSVIHMVLKDHGQVYTESSGEGEQRKVTILAQGPVAAGGDRRSAWDHGRRALAHGRVASDQLVNGACRL